jgi:twinkle protein
MQVEALVASLHVHQHARVVCPNCSDERKKRDKDLVINRSGDVWVFFCHHCNTKGIVPVFKRERQQMVQVQSINTNTFDFLQKEHYDFLSTRGISKETADSAQLFAANKFFRKLNSNAKAIGFPYYKEGKLIGTKYRCLETKDFTQDAGGNNEFYGIDLIKEGPIVIVEGEIDALTLRECGIENVLSVPSGAPMKVSNGKIDASEDKKFEFVWNSFDILSKAPYVTIATDNDAAGQACAEELARRIGKDKCRLTTIPAKDLNEVMLRDGADAVRHVIASALPYPVAGLSEATKYEERLNDLWEKGNGKGESTGYSNVDQIYTVAQGQLTVVTGYPSSGKSNFVDQLMVNLARANDWKFAICSFENAPEIHISRLMELYAQKRFFEGAHRMSQQEKDDAFKWVKDHFLFLDSEGVEPSTIDSIIERARAAVARIGIRGLVIDPYNYIDNGKGQAETEFISGMLTRVQAFAKAYGVHVWFVAHPSKITRSGMDLPRPDGMAISGSMAWWAKADCGITVHRAKPNVEIAVWKCRYRWIGQQGETTLAYDKTTGSYFEDQSDDFI